MVVQLIHNLEQQEQQTPSCRKYELLSVLLAMNRKVSKKSWVDLRSTTC